MVAGTVAAIAGSTAFTVGSSKGTINKGHAPAEAEVRRLRAPVQAEAETSEVNWVKSLALGAALGLAVTVGATEAQAAAATNAAADRAATAKSQADAVAAGVAKAKGGKIRKGNKGLEELSKRTTEDVSKKDTPLLGYNAPVDNRGISLIKKAKASSGPSGPPAWSFTQDFLGGVSAPSVGDLVGDFSAPLGIAVGAGVALGLPAISLGGQVLNRIEEKKAEDRRKAIEQAEFANTVGPLVTGALAVGAAGLIAGSGILSVAFEAGAPPSRRPVRPVRRSDDRDAR